MNFAVFLEPSVQELYLRGLWLTLALLGLSLVASFLLSIPLSILRNSRFRPIKYTIWAYTYVMRGTPLLLQLYLIYFGVSQFEAVRSSVAWVVLSDPFYCALLALTLNEVAYTTEIFAGAIRQLPHGEIEAAYAYGMKWHTILRRIILPCALRNSLPAYSNEVIILLHSTSLASTVTLMDLTGAANDVYSTYYLPFEAFMAAAAVYMVLTYVFVRLFRFAEKCLLAHQRPRPV